MDVTLSQIGASGFDKQIVSTVHWVRITAWLQPMLAVLLLLGSALLREDVGTDFAHVRPGVRVAGAESSSR